MEDSPRQRLLESAGAAFAQHGFSGVSVRDICHSAGANIAAVNYYFGDKERLYIEAVKFACQRSAAKYPMPIWTAHIPASQRLYEFIHIFVNRMMDPDSKPWQTQLLLRELAQPTQACTEWIVEYVEPMAAQLKAILGELAPSSMPEDRIFLIGFSIVGQCLYYRQNRPIGAQLMGPERFERLSPEAIAKHICNFTGAALGFQPPLLAAPSKTKMVQVKRQRNLTSRRR
jgi:AcrR family transcriptional regulator